MKLLTTIFRFWAVAVLLVTSCAKDPLTNGNKPGNNRTLRFSVTTPDETLIESRAGKAGDNTVNDLYVLVFDGNQDGSALKDYAEASSKGAGVYYANLTNSTDGGHVYVFANIATEMADMDFTGSQTLKSIREKLLVKLKQKDGNIIVDPQSGPMSSELIDCTGGIPDNKIDVTLTRSTAKVTVEDMSGDTKYTLLGVNIGNAPAKGYAVPNVGSVVSPDLADYAGLVYGDTYSIDAMMCGTDPAVPNTTEPIYLFESPKANETFVIIKGEYGGVVGYHRLNLWDRSAQPAPVYYDITRNYHYKIQIAKIASAGYPTAAQAMAAPASNRDVDFDIVVTDPYSHDIVTNGEQYLGVSNSALKIYQTGAISGLTAAVLNYTVPADPSVWSPGSVVAKGDGLTLAGAAGSGTTLSLPVVEIKNQDLKINLGTNFTTGTLTIRIGDLAKVITVTKANNLAAVPDEMLFSHAVVGDRSTSGTMKDYIKFASKSGIYPDVVDYDNIYTSDSDKLYALVSANVGYAENISERSGEFYVASARDEGRTKIMFYQEKLDVYTQLSQIRPYTYVGTFHRWNQTAERLIRIFPTDPNPDHIWTAMVVVGQDFIELDTEESNDSGIHSELPYGCNDVRNTPSVYDQAWYTTDDEIEANCQFKPEQKGKTIVSGNGDKIFFRVGMKSQLAGPTAQPRYGLIAFLHSEGTHMIYVRQGEEADYLMRPEDDIDSEVVLANRPEAVKIQPYNMTVPDAQKTDNWVDLPVGGGVQTQYPSQGGYLFQGVSRRAYFPVGTPDDVNWTNGSETAAGSGDICPTIGSTSFRRPNDGAPINGGFVVGSEMRQSFWLKPRNGYEQSSYDNMLRGYIADGYFDRRPMRVPNGQGHANEGQATYETETVTVNGQPKTYTVPTLVGEGAEIGYAGMLIYNPNTYASIFIPGNGSRTGQTMPFGKLVGTGAESNLWASSYFNGSQMWYLATGYYYSYISWSSSFVFDNYRSVATMEALSIRCVTK